jgi:hypothetical protein
MDEPRACLRRRGRHMSSAVDVDGVGKLRLALGAVDIGVRRAVDDALRRRAADRRQRLVPVGDIEFRPAQSDDLMTSGGGRLGDVAAEHAGGSGDQ